MAAVSADTAEADPSHHGEEDDDYLYPAVHVERFQEFMIAITIPGTPADALWPDSQGQQSSICSSSMDYLSYLFISVI